MKTVTEEILREMKLHEQIEINNYLQVIRVIGGWLYNQFVVESQSITTVFVPER
jgi:hypothetical protein